MSIAIASIIPAQAAPSTAATLYTVPALTHVIIDKFTATNTDTSTRTLTIYLVPQGGAAGAANTIIDQLSLTTLLTVDISALQNQILNPGDQIVVSASVASVVVVRASGRLAT